MLTTTCPAHPLGAPDGLTCTRTDVHGKGHTFQAAWLPDAKTEEYGDD